MFGTGGYPIDRVAEPVWTLYDRRAPTRMTHEELGELVRPFIEMGLVEMAVASDGEVCYRMRADVTEEQLLAALAAVGQEPEARDA